MDVTLTPEQFEVLTRAVSELEQIKTLVSSIYTLLMFGFLISATFYILYKFFFRYI